MRKNPIVRGEILNGYIDDLASGNPSLVACAFPFVNKNKIIHEGCNNFGIATNNTAEYQAIINALKNAERFHRFSHNCTPTVT